MFQTVFIADISWVITLILTLSIHVGLMCWSDLSLSISKVSQYWYEASSRPLGCSRRVCNGWAHHIHMYPQHQTGRTLSNPLIVTEQPSWLLIPVATEGPVTSVTYCIPSHNWVGPHRVCNVMQWVPHGVYHGQVYFPVSHHGINLELFWN